MRFQVTVYAADETKSSGRSRAARFNVVGDDVSEALVKTKASLEDLTSAQRERLVRIQIEAVADEDENVSFTFPDAPTTGKKGK